MTCGKCEHYKKKKGIGGGLWMKEAIKWLAMGITIYMAYVIGLSVGVWI